MTAGRPAPDSGPATGGRRNRKTRGRRLPRGLRGELLAFFVVSLFAVLAVAAATIVLSGGIAKDNQLDDAEQTATRIAEKLGAPLLAGPADGLTDEQLDDVLASRLQDGSVAAFFVLSPDGEVLWSPQAGLEGKPLWPSDELQEAFGGHTVSDVDEHPEQELPGVEGPLLEVYVPMTVDGERLVFETYFSAENIDRAAA